MRLSPFKALTFDCYGTLIDWEAGIARVLRVWAKRRGVKAGDEHLLELFSAAESRVERETPRALYPDVLRATQRAIADQLAVVSNPADEDALANSVGDWPPFADTVAALERLKLWHKLVILSNVDRASFARTNEKLQVTFDAIVTAQDVGAYKPDTRGFHHVLELLGREGVQPSQILHVAQSLYHDHVPAKSLGLHTVWVNRRHDKAGPGATPAPANAVTPDLIVNSLAELVALEEKERSAASA